MYHWIDYQRKSTSKGGATGMVTVAMNIALSDALWPRTALATALYAPNTIYRNLNISASVIIEFISEISG